MCRRERPIGKVGSWFQRRKHPDMTHKFRVDEDHASQELPEPQEWVERYGDALYRYALTRLRRSHEAEEVVQETFLTAFKARNQFQGQCVPLTWLTSILRRKILDRLRQAARHAAELDPADLDKSTLRISRPMDVAVLYCWVTETIATRLVIQG